MVNALTRELALRKNFFSQSPLDSIYLGGGTPSLLSQEELQKVFASIHHHFTFHKDAEITVEVNPDDCSLAALKNLAALGINRLSIGIQSFHDADLQYLGRVHNAEQAHGAIEKAQKAGFHNLTIDLMYGLPTAEKATWQENLRMLNTHNVPHFSAYALTLEPGTLLHRQVQQGSTAAPKEHQYESDFQCLQAFAAEQHFDHYEISNFARNGFQAVHNTSYWFSEPYLGIGPGAHSFDGQQRQWNITNNPHYIKALQGEELPCETEILSMNERFNERLMTGLRTKWGVDLEAIRQEFGAFYHQYLVEKLDKRLDQGLLEMAGQKVYLAPNQTLLADNIIADLFCVQSANLQS